MDESEDEIEGVEAGEEEASLIKRDAVVKAKEKEEKKSNAKADSEPHDDYDPAIDGASSNSSGREESEGPGKTRTAPN